jgi:hypothetical protein
MRALHIVQGGIKNGDKAWLEEAARNGWISESWVAPKNVAIDDDVVIYIADYGFFATARIHSSPVLRTDWKNRYGAGLEYIKLIEPAISLPVIRRTIPELTWAIYPRSITTPSLEVAGQVRRLIRERRKVGAQHLEETDLGEANLDELLTAALLKAQPRAPIQERTRRDRIRSQAIHLFVLRRANGKCEGCGVDAPFEKDDGTPYLEPHHTERLADDGPDHPAHVIALCPNCHRRAHSSKDRDNFNSRLIKRLAKIQPRR